MPIVKTNRGHQQVHVSNFAEATIHVDGLEALQTTTNSKLDTIATNTANVNLNVDTLEALQATTNAKLIEISGKNTDIDVSVKANSVTVAKLNQILTKNTEIDNVLDSCSAKLTDVDDSVKANAVTVAKLNQILTKNTEIDNVLDSCSAKLSDIDTTSAATATILRPFLIEGNGHLSEIEGAVETLEGCVASSKVNVNISSVGGGGLASEAKQDALISANHTDLVALEASLTSMEGKMDVDNGVYDNQLTKLGEISAKNTDIDNSVKANAITVAKLNQILTKNTEIDTVLDSCSQKLTDVDDSVKANSITVAKLNQILTKNTEIEVTNNANQVLLGTIDSDTNAIKVSAAALVVDTAANEVLLTSILAKNSEIEVTNNANQVLLGTIDSDTNDIKTDMAAIEILLTAANVDHAANEVLLTGIDADTNAIKIDLAAIEVLETAILAKLAPVKTHQVLFSNVSIDGTSSAVSAAIDCRTIKHIAFFGQDDSESQCEIVFLACATSGGTYNTFHYSVKASGILNNSTAGHTLPIFTDIPYSFIKVKISNGGSTSTFNMTAALSS